MIEKKNKALGHRLNSSGAGWGHVRGFCEHDNEPVHATLELFDAG
jgi:hypothetical protein